jgi:hypothetical protein
VLALLFMVLNLALPFGREADIAGTWTGDAGMPGLTDPDHLTLVLESNGDSYSGKLPDRAGIVLDVPLKDVTFKNGNLRFKATIWSGGTEMILTKRNPSHEPGCALQYVRGRSV